MGTLDPGVRVGQGDQWTKIEVEDDGSNEWQVFAQAINQDMEIPASGVYARRIMEIIFATEELAITNQEVRLHSGPGWFSQDSGQVANYEHGWY